MEAGDWLLRKMEIRFHTIYGCVIMRVFRSIKPMFLKLYDRISRYTQYLWELRFFLVYICFAVKTFIFILFKC